MLIGSLLVKKIRLHSAFATVFAEQACCGARVPNEWVYSLKSVWKIWYGGQRRLRARWQFSLQQIHHQQRKTQASHHKLRTVSAKWAIGSAAGSHVYTCFIRRSKYTLPNTSTLPLCRTPNLTSCSFICLLWQVSRYWRLFAIFHTTIAREYISRIIVSFVFSDTCRVHYTNPWRCLPTFCILPVRTRRCTCTEHAVSLKRSTKDMVRWRSTWKLKIQRLVWKWASKDSAIKQINSHSMRSHGLIVWQNQTRRLTYLCAMRRVNPERIPARNIDIWQWENRQTIHSLTVCNM